MNYRILFLMVIFWFTSDAILAMNDIPSSKKRQRSVKVACLRCRKKHQACDDQRPCTRCINANERDLCQDASRKKTKTELNSNLKHNFPTSYGNINISTPSDSDDCNFVVRNGLLLDVPEDNTLKTTLKPDQFDMNVFNQAGAPKGKPRNKKNLRWIPVTFDKTDTITTGDSAHKILPSSEQQNVLCGTTKERNVPIPERDPLDDAFALDSEK